MFSFKGFSLTFGPVNIQKKQQKTDLPAGPAGEDIAASYLQGLGYTIITRNYRRRFGEIDIVARDGDVLVFVEVKARRSTRCGSPFEAVDRRKQRQISRVALDYITRHGLEDQAARFDVVAVLLHKNGSPLIEIVKNAFEFQD